MNTIGNQDHDTRMRNMIPNHSGPPPAAPKRQRTTRRKPGEDNDHATLVTVNNNGSRKADKQTTENTMAQTAIMDLMHIERRLGNINTEAAALQPSLIGINFTAMENIEDGEDEEGTPLTAQQHKKMAARTDTLLAHTRNLQKEYDDFCSYISKEAGVERMDSSKDADNPTGEADTKPAAKTSRKADRPEPMDVLHLQRRIGKVGSEAAALPNIFAIIDFTAMENIEDGENEEGTPLTERQYRRIAERVETLLEHTRNLQDEYDRFVDYICKEAGVERWDDRLSR